MRNILHDIFITSKFFSKVHSIVYADSKRRSYIRLMPYAQIQAEVDNKMTYTRILKIHLNTHKISKKLLKYTLKSLQK